MKKITRYFFLIAVMFISSFFFFGCELFSNGNGGDVTQLQTPSAPTITYVNNKITASTNAVENASSYQLLINGIPYNSTEPVFDCTNYIIEAGEYSFKIVALGVGKYSNSSYSQESFFTYTKKLSTPVLTINNSVLSWGAVENANQYDVYLNNSKLITTTELSINLASEEFENYFANIGSYELKIKANTNGFHTESDISNVVTYKIYKQISAPENLYIVKSGETFVLKWNYVPFANSYVVMIDGVELQTQEPITTTSIDVSTYLTQAKNYSFKVKALTEAEYYTSSDYSEEFSYARTIKLQTPQITAALFDDSVRLTWQAIEFAQTYSVYINNEKYEREVWTTSSSQVTVSLLKTYLNNFTKPLKFKVIANGYENYLQSAYSNIETISSYGKLAVPTNIAVEKVDGLVQLTFNAVNNAETYSVMVDNSYIKTTKLTKVDLSELITEPKVYEIKVKANETSQFEESSYSQTVSYLNTGKLQVPTNLKIQMVNSKFNFSWDEVENASGYFISIYYYDGITTENILTANVSETTYTYAVSKAGEYSFNVVAVGTGVYENSAQSATVSKIHTVKLTTPSELKVTEANKVVTLTWKAVENVSYYTVYVTLDENVSQLTTTATSIMVDLAGKAEGVYYFQVMAVATQNGYFTNSENSVAVAYVYGEEENIGETYYYHGEERDFNIVSQEELNHVISYAVLYKYSEIELEILFDYTADLSDSDFNEAIAEELSAYTQSDVTILNEFITALYSYNRDMGGWSNANYAQNSSTNFVFYINKYLGDDIPTVTSSQEETERSEIFNPYSVEQLGLTKRTATYDAFYIETLEETVEVYTSNQLVEALAFPNRKPVFKVENSYAQQVYTMAKDVLREIVSDDMSDFQKVVAIYDWLVYNVTYDYAALNQEESDNANDYYCYYAEGVFFNRIAVCNGIAKAFTILCGIEGIESRHVVGEIVDMGGHAWNKVKIEDEWYVVDATNGTIGAENGTFLSHFRYFLVSDNKISDFVAYSIGIPESPNSLSYYDNMNLTEDYDLNITSVEEVKAIASLIFGEMNRQGFECYINISNTELADVMFILQTIGYYVRIQSIGNYCFVSLNA